MVGFNFPRHSEAQQIYQVGDGGAPDIYYLIDYEQAYNCKFQYRKDEYRRCTRQRISRASQEVLRPKNLLLSSFLSSGDDRGDHGCHRQYKLVTIRAVVLLMVCPFRDRQRSFKYSERNCANR